ncbi:MAG: OmpA family protein, partial [Spirochaetales bacterium]|nr:OmpA family protein [Spirochaetales bacterium]
NLKVGDKWTARGEEVHDLRRSFGINDAFHFPINVNYIYKGKIKKNGRELFVIGIDYSVFYKVKYKYRYSNIVPSVITGYSHQTYYWNNDSGKPESYREEFDFIYHLTSGDYVEYEGTAEGNVIHSITLDKKKAVEQIQKQIKENNLPDTTVKEDKHGVTINLENIHFPPNSPILVPAEKGKLDVIGKILKQFPNRDILITGHTAKIGTEQSCQVLSEERAKAVGDYLLSIGAKKATQMIFRGKGAKEPVADNSTEEGRKLNRRVEITILEN